jgi:peptidyl-prolyl cis-trans isomerase A (cyclophilin A)
MENKKGKMRNSRRLFVVGICLAVTSLACSEGEKTKTAEKVEKAKMPEKGEEAKMPEKIHAVFETSKGRITCVLYPEKAPKTVENFVGLAKGTKEWIDPRTKQKVKVPLYDGTIFHRVIPKFMIQGGDPLGLGIGGPGYRFEDEIVKDLVFDRPGKLAMANSGPNTNGSQFFITVVPTPWLNGRHTIFGQVTEGQDVVEAITQVERDKRDKPLEPVVLKKLVIKEAP